MLVQIVHHIRMAPFGIVLFKHYYGAIASFATLYVPALLDLLVVLFATHCGIFCVYCVVQVCVVRELLPGRCPGADSGRGCLAPAG